MSDGGDVMSWKSRKNQISILFYAIAVVLSLWYAPLGALIHVLLAGVWLMPDARHRTSIEPLTK